MLNSVSGVNFKGNPILEREGKFTQTQQPQAVTPEMPADKFDKPEKKRTGLKAALWTVGVLAAAAIGLAAYSLSVHGTRARGVDCMARVRAQNCAARPAFSKISYTIRKEHKLREEFPWTQRYRK